MRIYIRWTDHQGEPQSMWVGPGGTFTHYSDGRLMVDDPSTGMIHHFLSWDCIQWEVG